MIVDEASVTVTIAIGGTTSVYEFERVQDLMIETIQDPPPYVSFSPSRRVTREDPPRSITFSMRPLANNNDGEYMRVTIREEQN